MGPSNVSARLQRVMSACVACVSAARRRMKRLPRQPAPGGSAYFSSQNPFQRLSFQL
jgi:hypothetical protein